MLLGLFGLPAIAFPGGETPVWFRQAEANFELGADAYLSRQAYKEAAERFMRAAARFRPPPGDVPDVDWVRHRIASYRNAAVSWEMPVGLVGPLLLEGE
jgi:hypothetical protein